MVGARVKTAFGTMCTTTTSTAEWMSMQFLQILITEQKSLIIVNFFFRWILDTNIIGIALPDEIKHHHDEHSKSKKANISLRCFLFVFKHEIVVLNPWQETKTGRTDSAASIDIEALNSKEADKNPVSESSNMDQKEPGYVAMFSAPAHSSFSVLLLRLTTKHVRAQRYVTYAKKRKWCDGRRLQWCYGQQHAAVGFYRCTKTFLNPNFSIHKLIPSWKAEHEEHEGMDAASLKEHEEVTKVKNVNKIEMGRHTIQTW